MTTLLAKSGVVSKSPAHSAPAVPKPLEEESEEANAWLWAEEDPIPEPSRVELVRNSYFHVGPVAGRVSFQGFNASIEKFASGHKAVPSIFADVDEDGEVVQGNKSGLDKRTWAGTQLTSDKSTDGRL